jgi:transposase InsO family protein
MSHLLRDEGWRVNHKRVHRLWKQEGYKVPKKHRKKRAIGVDANACDKRAATRANDVWTWDFIHDRLVDGRALKCLSIVDEYTRECLELRMERSIKGGDVLDTLSRLIGERGAPAHIRSDNGSEFIAGEVKNWLTSLGVETMYIAPGAPWQNGFAESFHSRLRDEFLEMDYFTTMKESKELARRWQDHYNTKRLHSSLGYKTPAQFARVCGGRGSASLRSAPPRPPHTRPAGTTP